MSYDTSTPPPSPLFEKTKIKKINEVPSSLSSIIKQNTQFEKDIPTEQSIIIKNSKDTSPIQTLNNNKPPLYISNNSKINFTHNSYEKKGVFLLKNKGLKLNSSLIDTNVDYAIFQSKYQKITVGSLPIMTAGTNGLKYNHLNIPTNQNENKQPLFPETNYSTKHHHHHHHHQHSKKPIEKRWGGGGGRSITVSHDGSEFIHKHNDNIIDPKDYENTSKNSNNVEIVITKEKEDYSKVHPLSLIMENLSCYPSYHSYDSSFDKKINKNTNPDLLSLKKDDAVAVQHFFPDGWAFGYHPASGESGMFPLKCIKMAESGGTGIVLFPPTEADLLMTDIKDVESTEVEKNLIDKYKDSDKNLSEINSDGDCINKALNIYNESDTNQSLNNNFVSGHSLSFTSPIPIPIPSSSNSINYENSFSSSYFSSSSLASSNSSLSSSLDSNQHVYSPPVAINTDYNLNNPFSNNYKNNSYWVSESLSPKSAPSLLNYKSEKSLLINNNNSKDNNNNNKNDIKIENSSLDYKPKSESPLKESIIPQNQEDNIVKNITPKLSLLTLKEQSENKNEIKKMQSNDNKLILEKETKNDVKEGEILLPFVQKPKIDTSVSTNSQTTSEKKSIIIKPVISPSSSYEKALPIFPQNMKEDNKESSLPITLLKSSNDNPHSSSLPIANGNNNELPLLSSRPRRRRQRKDISDCNEFLKNRLTDPTLPIQIRKRYQYYIDSNF